MPRLGPAFLHRPLALPAQASVYPALRWLIDGALSILPTSIRERGWRATNTIYTYSPNGELSQCGQLVKSWSGATQQAAKTESSKTLPTIIALDPKLVFLTQADLPLAARTTLAKTVALRMDELSPIPPSQAAFAIGQTTVNADRLHVGVAITRKQTLEEVARALDGNDVSSIGAEMSANGMLAFIFTRSKTTASQNTRKLLLSVLALWTSLLLALGAFSSRQEKVLTSLDQRQTALRQELRDLKVTDDNVRLLEQFAPKTFSLSDVSAAVALQLNDLAQAALVGGIAVEDNAITITGFTSDEQDIGSDQINRSPSDYPGFDQFTTSAPLSEENIGEAGDE